MLGFACARARAHVCRSDGAEDEFCGQVKHES